MRFNLISCNIRFDNPADEDNSWIHRREILAQTLLKHSPDIISTQEGRFHQLKDLESLLPGFKLIENHRSWIKDRMYPTIFVREEKFEILSSEDLWLSSTPHIAGSFSFDSAFPRLMTWAKIQPKNYNVPLFIVNTHLDHIKAETRKNQVQVLTEQIKKGHANGCPLIIMGDFNDSPQSEVRKILINHFPNLEDAWSVFNKIEETSHHAFKGEIQNGSRIDWILVDKKIKLENCLMDKSTVNGKYPTDHFPIVCNISL